MLAYTTQNCFIAHLRGKHLTDFARLGRCLFLKIFLARRSRKAVAENQETKFRESLAAIPSFEHDAASRSAAEGALLGLCIGDAAGAPLEYPRSGFWSSEKVNFALHMHGGGIYQVVGPGQGTDDTEMALSLANSLLAASPPDLPVEEIAAAYVKWSRTQSIDIGNACQVAFLAGKEAAEASASIAEACKAAARKFNLRSQTNNALNRVLPLAIWAWREDNKAIATLARQEAELSHTHPIVQDCSSAYCIAISHLIKQPGCPEAAFTAAKCWAAEEASTVINEWLLLSRDSDYDPNINVEAGWVKWGFIFAFRCLFQQLSFEESLRQILSKGGDTDTNAAIVGGMMGALHGLDGIPERLKAPVLARSSSSLGKPTPSHLCASQVPDLSRKLYSLGGGRFG